MASARFGLYLFLKRSFFYTLRSVKNVRYCQLSLLSDTYRRNRNRRFRFRRFFRFINAASYAVYLVHAKPLKKKYSLLTVIACVFTLTSSKIKRQQFLLRLWIEEVLKNGMCKFYAKVYSTTSSEGNHFSFKSSIKPENFNFKITEFTSFLKGLPNGKAKP